MSHEPLKIGLVGYGLAGKVFHTPLYEAANVQLIAVSSSDSDKVHADHPHVRVHSTPSALINDSEVELVVLASPSYTHAPLMLESLAAGKHVLSDRPFTATVRQADEVIEAAEAAGGFWHYRQFSGTYGARPITYRIVGWPAYYRELSAAIRQDGTPPVTAHQARNTIAVIEAMVESSRTGKRVAPG